MLSEKQNKGKVGIYCRISKDKGAQDKSIEDQRLLGQEYADSKNHTYEVYIDEGLSGTIEERPAFQKLMLDIMGGEIQVLWTYDDSRIQRNPETRYLINNQLKKSKVEYVTHINGTVDLYNPESDLMGGVLAEFNKYFVAMTKFKVKSVLRRRAISGKGWGIPLYGYRYDKLGYYEINQVEAKVVKRIFALSLKGIGIDSIAHKLNSENVPTRYNGYSGVIELNKSKGVERVKKIEKKNVKWAGNTIRGIIKNPAYYGKKKIKEITVDVPPLFDINYWDEVNHNFRTKNKNTKRSGGIKKYQYLLNGIVTCGKCGKNYNGKTREDKRDHFYYCMSKRVKGGNCKNRSINIEKLESFVWEALFVNSRIRESILADSADANKILKYKTELSSEKKRLLQDNIGKNNILEMVKAGTLTTDEVREKMAAIRIEIENRNKNISELNKKINAVELGGTTELNGSKAYFRNLSFEKREALVRKFIKNIAIFWVDETLQGVRVQYYVVKIHYAVNDIVEIYTNGYCLYLDQWSSVRFDKKQQDIYLDYQFNSRKNVCEVPFFSFTEGTYPYYTTIVPNGDVSMWEEQDLINYYGEVKFKVATAELEHKRKYLKSFFT